MSTDNVIPRPVATVLLELLARGKPFTLSQLEAAVREHLEKNPTEGAAVAPDAPISQQRYVAGGKNSTGPISDEPLVVHALREGLPLCGFTTKPPAEWPSNHRWTTAPYGAVRATCETCNNMLDVEDTTRAD